VLNVGKMGSTKHVGHAVLRLKSFFSQLDKPLPLTLNLTHTPSSGPPLLKGQFISSVVLTLEPSEKPQDVQRKSAKGSADSSAKNPIQSKNEKMDPLLTVADKSVQMKLIIAALEVSDLVDTGTSSDPQDPCLQINIGEGKNVKSKVTNR
jgi:hypothetical protein